jgi:hypothetical protein
MTISFTKAMLFYSHLYQCQPSEIRRSMQPPLLAYVSSQIWVKTARTSS